MVWKYQWLSETATSWNVIIHHSLTKDSKTVSWNAIKDYHTNKLGWLDIGYHFGIELVDDKYQIFTGRPLGTVGAHTKENAMNQKSIGICFIGNYDAEDVPDAMYDTGINLIAGLCEATRCSSDLIFPHNKFATYKSCPGTRFDMHRLIRGVKKISMI